MTWTQRPVTIPYVKGVSKALSWVFHCHDAAMAMKPHFTIKRMLVHSKDKSTPPESAGVVYQVTCNAVSVEEMKFKQARRKSLSLKCTLQLSMIMSQRTTTP